LKGQRKKINIAPILATIAGILILIDGVVWLTDPNFYDILGIGEGFWGIFGNYPPSPSLLGGITILFAIIVLVGAYIMYMSAGYEIVGGIAVALFSLISLVVGGGFIVGTILGIIAGIFGILGTREPIEEAVIKPKDQEPHEKF
jgi:hypothetical protein